MPTFNVLITYRSLFLMQSTRLKPKMQNEDYDGRCQRYFLARYSERIKRLSNDTGQRYIFSQNCSHADIWLLGAGFTQYNLLPEIEDPVLPFLLADNSFCLAQSRHQHNGKVSDYLWAHQDHYNRDGIFWEAFGCYPEEWINILTHFETDRVLSSDPFRAWITKNEGRSRESFASITDQLEQQASFDSPSEAGRIFSHMWGRLNHVESDLQHADLGMVHDFIFLYLVNG